MLQIKNLYKVFYPNTVNENKLFNGLSIQVDKGDFITILGSNGAGKSTLLNIVAGTIKSEEGSIILDGVDITKKMNI